MGGRASGTTRRRAAKTSAAHASAQKRKLDSFRALRGRRRRPRGARRARRRRRGDRRRARRPARPRSRSGSPSSRRRACSAAATTRGDAVVTVRAGAGGTDSQDWAEMLLRMYLRWAERRGFKAEMKEASPGEEAGIKSATFVARARTPTASSPPSAASTGSSASRRSTRRSAPHRVRPARRRAARRGRRRRSSIDEGDLRIDTYRASGAGGQHVNKTDSAVRITHIPTGIVVQCQNERSQAQNKATAMQLLQARLLAEEERRRADELAAERGEQKAAEWGSQIRSYTLHPSTRVKDHRTGHEVGDASRVLDGDLDGFVREYLLKSAGNSGLARFRHTVEQPAAWATRRSIGEGVRGSSEHAAARSRRRSPRSAARGQLGVGGGQAEPVSWPANCVGEHRDYRRAALVDLLAQHRRRALRRHQHEPPGDRVGARRPRGSRAAPASRSSRGSSAGAGSPAGTRRAGRGRARPRA